MVKNCGSGWILCHFSAHRHSQPVETWSKSLKSIWSESESEHDDPYKASHDQSFITHCVNLCIRTDENAEILSGRLFYFWLKYVRCHWKKREFIKDNTDGNLNKSGVSIEPEFGCRRWTSLLLKNDRNGWWFRCFENVKWKCEMKMCPAYKLHFRRHHVRTTWCTFTI